MGSGTSFIIGGLLQGLGKGVTDMHEERRQDALLKLKRDQQLQDNATEATTAEATRVQALADKKELLRTGTEADLVKENRQHLNKLDERANDFKYDASLERVKAGLDLKKDAASKQLAAEIDSGQVQSTQIAEDGSMVVTYKGGSVVTKNIKLHLPPDTSGGDTGGSIADARAGRGGGAAIKPAAPAATGPSEQSIALARLGQMYANATPDRYPGLFRNGRKISIDEAKGAILARYPQ